MPKKYFNFLLITMAFIIWMVIFYQLVIDDKNVENNNILGNQNFMQAPNSLNNENIDKYLSKANLDPFITPYNNSTPKPKLSNPKLPFKLQSIPRLQLLGILSDKEGSMAIIGFPDNLIRFVRENQKIDKFTIIDITAKKVEYKYESFKQTVKLE